jgi:arylsulfatase A-like enzyme
MCSTTRAALLTGRNHHAVGRGCLANFGSGFPGYRGQIARDAATLAEMLRPHGYNNSMVGKWHVTGPAALRRIAAAVARSGFNSLPEASLAQAVHCTSHGSRVNAYLVDIATN